MMNIKQIRFSALFVAVGLFYTSLLEIAIGSGAASYRFDSATFVSERESIEITVSKMMTKESSVRIKMGSKSIQVDSKYLFNLGKVSWESIKLINPSSNPGKSDPGDYIRHGFIVSMKFGEIYEHGTEGDPAKVKSVEKVLRLYFSKDGFVKSELAVPRGDFKNIWDVYSIESGEKQSKKIYSENSILDPWRDP